MVERLDPGDGDLALTSSDNIEEEDNQSPRFPNRSFSETPISPKENDPSAISLLAKDCLQRFQNICNILQSPEPSENDQNGLDRDLALLTMLDARARFKAWGGSIAAFHDGLTRTSLDFRLREASGMRRRALQILEYLQEYLHEATMIIAGEKSNEIWDSVSDSSDESEREEIPSDDEKKEDKQKEKGKWDKDGQISELQQLFSAISSSNASLMKLSMVIRSSPTRDDYLKAALRYKDWNPYPDIGHVKEKHGSAKRSTDWLLQRLGKGITRRRQFLKYRVDHFEKLSGDFNEQKAGKEDEKPGRTIASTKATTFLGNDNKYQMEGSDTAGTFGSQTSYEATVLGDENASNRLTVPPPPKLAFPDITFEFGEPFNCPYCYTEQNVKNKAAWKKHVFRDLKPYVCTFKGCDMMMFRSRNEWFAHELQNHRRQWMCQYCQHGAFTTSAAFSKHISSSHPEALASSQLEALLLQNEEAVDTISAFACPLCDDWETNIKARKGKQDPGFKLLNDGEVLEPHGTRNQFRRHLGRHMEQLALFALPMSEIAELDNDSTDGDQDDDSNHSLKASVDDSPTVVTATEPATMPIFAPPEIQAKDENRGIPLSPTPDAVPQSTETYDDDEVELNTRINRGRNSPVPVAHFENPSSPIPEPDPRSTGLDYYDDDEIEVKVHRNRGRAEPQRIYYQHGNSYVVPRSSDPPDRPPSVDWKHNPPAPILVNTIIYNEGYESFDDENDSSNPVHLQRSSRRRDHAPSRPRAPLYHDPTRPTRSRSGSRGRETSTTNLELQLELERTRRELEAYKRREDEEMRINQENLHRLRQEEVVREKRQLRRFGEQEAVARYKGKETETPEKQKKDSEEREKEYQIRLEEDLRKAGMDERQIVLLTEKEEAVARYNAQEAEKVEKERKENEEREKEYHIRLEEDLRKAGMDERQIAALVTKGRTAAAPKRATYTRMARRHLSLETLNTYRIDYQLDTDSEYVLIKRWVPEYEQDFLWSHTREIRDKRKLPATLPSAEGSKTQLGSPEYEFSGKKKRYMPSPSSPLGFLAGGRRTEGRDIEKKT